MTITFEQMVKEARESGSFKTVVGDRVFEACFKHDFLILKVDGASYTTRGFEHAMNREQGKLSTGVPPITSITCPPGTDLAAVRAIFPDTPIKLDVNPVNREDEAMTLVRQLTGDLESMAVGFEAMRFYDRSEMVRRLLELAK